MSKNILEQLFEFRSEDNLIAKSYLEQLYTLLKNNNLMPPIISNNQYFGKSLSLNQQSKYKKFISEKSQISSTDMQSNNQLKKNNIYNQLNDFSVINNTSMQYNHDEFKMNEYGFHHSIMLNSQHNKVIQKTKQLSNDSQDNIQINKQQFDHQLIINKKNNKKNNHKSNQKVHRFKIMPSIQGDVFIILKAKNKKKHQRLSMNQFGLARILKMKQKQSKLNKQDQNDINGDNNMKSLKIQRIRKFKKIQKIKKVYKKSETNVDWKPTCYIPYLKPRQNDFIQLERDRNCNINKFYSFPERNTNQFQLLIEKKRQSLLQRECKVAYFKFDKDSKQ